MIAEYAWIGWVVGPLVVAAGSLIGTKVLVGRLGEKIEQLEKGVDEAQADARADATEKKQLSDRIASLEHLVDFTRLVEKLDEFAKVLPELRQIQMSINSVSAAVGRPELMHALAEINARMSAQDNSALLTAQALEAARARIHILIGGVQSIMLKMGMDKAADTMQNRLERIGERAQDDV